MYDIIVRDCGAVGFLGILTVNEVEIYRTGVHFDTAIKAFNRVSMQLKNIKEYC